MLNPQYSYVQKEGQEGKCTENKRSEDIGKERDIKGPQKLLQKGMFWGSARAGFILGKEKLREAFGGEDHQHS